MEKKEKKHNARQRKPLRGQLALPLINDKGSAREQYERAFRAWRVTRGRGDYSQSSEQLAKAYNVEKDIMRKARYSFWSAK